MGHKYNIQEKIKGMWKWYIIKTYVKVYQGIPIWNCLRSITYDGINKEKMYKGA